MPDILLSIVVPTRNRQDCATSLLRGFAAFPEARVELVLHDNSGDASLEGVVAALGDPRIRYIYVAEPLSMHDNFDRAIAAARGRYVCAIGDDDGMIVSEAVKVLDRAAALDADAVLTAVPGFLWPGTAHRIWGESRGELVAAHSVVEAEHVLDPEQELAAVFASGMIHSLGRLPRVYQGFVSRVSLEALRDRCGTCFPGPSPDMANAVALVPFVNRILVSPRPTVISGHSPRSGGGSGSAGTHHGRLEKQSHFPPGTIENWTDAVPRFWSGPTIYAQSAILARKASGRPLPRIGYPRLYAACLVYERRDYWRDVARALPHAPGPRIATTLSTAFHAARLLAVRTRTFLGNYVRNRTKPAPDVVADIEAAMRESERRLAGSAFQRTT